MRATEMSRLRNQLDFDELLSALDGEVDGVKTVNERQLVGQRLARGDDAAIDEKDEIIRLDSNFGSSRGGFDAFDEGRRARQEIGNELKSERCQRVMLLRLFLALLAGQRTELAGNNLIDDGL